MKANVPKSFKSLPLREQEAIKKLIEDEVAAKVNHEEAEMQKIWIKLACIILRRAFWFGKDQLFLFIGNWHNIYRANARIKTAAEQRDFINSALNEVFDGDFPDEFLDSLEEIGENEKPGC